MPAATTLRQTMMMMIRSFSCNTAEIQNLGTSDRQDEHFAFGETIFIAGFRGHNVNFHENLKLDTV